MSVRRATRRRQCQVRQKFGVHAPNSRRRRRHPAELPPWPTTGSFPDGHERRRPLDSSADLRPRGFQIAILTDPTRPHGPAAHCGQPTLPSESCASIPVGNPGRPRAVPRAAQRPAGSSALADEPETHCLYSDRPATAAPPVGGRSVPALDPDVCRSCDGRRGRRPTGALKDYRAPDYVG